MGTTPLKILPDKGKMLETTDIGKLIHDPPPLREEVIKGLLRMGHKAILTGGSKTGKTFLLLELAAALATGGEWLGFECRRSRVLYINFEIDEESIADRIWMRCATRSRTLCAEILLVLIEVLLC